MLAILKKRGSDEYREYKEAIQMVKEGIETICELTDDMEEQYGERSYGERGVSRMRHYRRENWEDMDERHGRRY